MKDLLEKCCGLDVHKDIIVACILSGPIGKTTVSEIREFSTLASGLAQLRDWIILSGCSHVAMETPAFTGLPSTRFLKPLQRGLRFWL